MEEVTATPSLERLARGTAVLAWVTGVYGVLAMMGAFGPVSCWTSRSASSDGTITTSRGCEAGIDYLFGHTGGNAPVLFFWSAVLLGLILVGGSAVWTSHRRVVWTAVIGGVVISVVGVMSIGWYFVLPTLSLLVGAVALTVAVRRQPDNGDPVPHE